MGIIKKLFGKKKKTIDELKSEVLKKATDNWNSNNNQPDSQIKTTKKSGLVHDDVVQEKNKNNRIVLLNLFERGATGALPRSISDKTGISMRDISNALTYLTKNNYAELVNSPNGVKYYITDIGRDYCKIKDK